MKSNLIFGIGMFLLGCGVGYTVHEYIQKEQPEVKVPQDTSAKMTEVRNSRDFRFISPLLECDGFMQSDIKVHSALRSKVKAVIRHWKSAGFVDRVSFYYRDLNNGPWIGVDEDIFYSPASMLKVVIMMAAFKRESIDPGFLDMEFSVIGSNTFKPNVTSESVSIGERHKLRFLVEMMIVKSDNYAKSTVQNAVGEPILHQVWNELGMSNELMAKSENFFSARKFATFFRILYNSTYLSHEHSEQALELLSRTEFSDGIRSGVPENVKVASKFGERGFVESTKTQIHECGIIYDNGSPYLICIMTEGDNLDQQTALISNLSRIVYEGRN